MNQQKSPEFINQLKHIESLCQQGKFNDAVPLLQSLIEAYPKDPILHNYLGKIYMFSGRPQLALKSFNKVIKLSPEFIEVYFNLGNVYAQLGKHNDAIKNFEKCIKNKGINEHVYNNLSASYLVLKQFDLALEACNKSLAINKNFINAIKNKGVINFLSHDEDINNSKNYRKIKLNLMEHIYPHKLMEASKYFKEYLRLDPKSDGDIYSFMGIIKTALHQYKGAIESFNSAMRIKGKNIKDLRALSKLHNSMDKVKEAVDTEEAALNIIKKENNKNLLSDSIGSLLIHYSALGEVEKLKSIFINHHFDDDLSFLQALRTSIGYLDHDHESNWCQRLMKCNNEAQRNTESHIFKTLTFYNMAEIYKKENKEKYLTFLNQSNEERRKDIKQNKKEDADIYESKEIIHQRWINKRKRIKEIYIPEYHSQLVPIFVIGMPRSSTTLTELILSSHSQVYGMGEVTMLQQHEDRFARHIENIETNDKDVVEYFCAVREKFMNRALDLLDGNQKFIVDKLPANWKCVDFILKLFPNAKIINTDRDPMAVSWSIYSNYFGAEMEWVNSLEMIGDEYINYKNAIKEYYADADIKDSIMDSSYDELVNSPDVAIKKLLNFCGLDWEDQCLKPQENKKAIRTISLQQGRQGIYKGSTEAWKEYSDFLKPLIDKYKESKII